MLLPENKVKPIIDGYEFSTETDKIISAFIGFQSKLEFAKKSQSNPFFNSKYADLKEVWVAIREPLIECNLAIMQFASLLGFTELKQKSKELRNTQKGERLIWNGKYDTIFVREILITTLMVHESGQWIKTWYIETPDDNDSQSRGKCVTYGRRYALMSLCGVCPEDDDGNRIPKDNKEPNNKPPNETKTKIPQKSYIRDKNNTPRYCIEDNALNEGYQIKHKLINTKQWRELQTLIQQKLGGNSKQFKVWLSGIYNFEVYDIPENAYSGIIKTINDNPDHIINYTENVDETDDLPF